RGAVVHRGRRQQDRAGHDRRDGQRVRGPDRRQLPLRDRGGARRGAVVRREQRQQDWAGHDRRDGQRVRGPDRLQPALWDRFGARGVVVRYALTGPAAVTLTVTPLGVGRSRRARASARAVTVAHASGRAGVNKIAWNRKLRGKPAPRGRYRLAVIASAGG